MTFCPFDIQLLFPSVEGGGAQKEKAERQKTGQEINELGKPFDKDGWTLKLSSFFPIPLENAFIPCLASS